MDELETKLRLFLEGMDDMRVEFKQADENNVLPEDGTNAMELFDSLYEELQSFIV